MNIPVLLGGRSALRRRGEFAYVVFVWLPVAVMLGIILRESTEAFGAVHTSPVLRPWFERFFGRVSDSAWDEIHHLLRKTGHFFGYGVLGLAWLRAFLFTWMWSFRQAAAAVWRRWSLQMAVCCTAVVASLDEVHQSYIPDRTGLVTDVLLDTVGAIVLCGIAALFWLRVSVRNPAMREG